MRMLFLITARGGSKGLPGKNVMELAGVSLIGWKARTARRSAHCARLVISTDSPEIMDAARAEGVDVPFVRPAELASDTAGSAEVVTHALTTLVAQGDAPYDAVMLLQPTSPFATAADYDAAVAAMARTGASLVFGVVEAPALSAPLGEDGAAAELVAAIAARASVRRQDLRPHFTPNGALYLIGTRPFLDSGRIFHDPKTSHAVVMDPVRSVDIDTRLDFEYAQFLISSGRIDPAEYLS
jgi:N-acylneuraminate cytidylyltransferase/CMP-N,N'-diacetyllegionaminic acid synthase